MSKAEKIVQSKTTFKDKTLVCKICNTGFLWSAGEQSFYSNRCLSPPKRCPDCRPPKGGKGYE